MTKQMNSNYPRYTWTKQSIWKVIDLWNSKTIEQIGTELGCNKKQVAYMANEIRKSGIDLPKKSKKGYLRNLIGEIIKEKRLKLVK